MSNQVSSQLTRSISTYFPNDPPEDIAILMNPTTEFLNPPISWPPAWAGQAGPARSLKARVDRQFGSAEVNQMETLFTAQQCRAVERHDKFALCII
jgi:hypothetical protein